MEKIVGKTRATDKCSAHAVKQPCRHRDPGLVPADGRYLVIYDWEKTGMHRVQRMLQQGHARKL